MITIKTAAATETFDFDAKFGTEENQAIIILEKRFPLTAFSNVIKNGEVVAWKADNGSVKATW
jgi:hypothetical protein